jgi:hypothetical protein
MDKDSARESNRQVRATAVPRAVIYVISAYIAAQMLADITSVKIAVVAGLAVDMGTFIYPITFTLRDVAHKVMGKRQTQTLIFTAAVVNVVMALYLMWTARVPADPNWGLNEAYASILGPLWRIVVASIIAEVVAELVDTEVYHWFVSRVTTRYQWARVLVSNSVSIPLDSLIFTVLAFGPLPGLQDHYLSLPWAVVGQIFVFNMLVKYAVTVVSMPLIYLYPDRDWAQEQKNEK